jgi:hypothetical protein
MQGLFFILLSLAAFLASPLAYSQANILGVTESTSETSIDSNKAKSIFDNFNSRIGAMGRSDFKETSDESKYVGSQLNLGVGYRFSPVDSIFLNNTMFKDLENNYEESFLDSRLTYTRAGIYKNKNMTVNLGFIGIIPVSERSTKRDRLTTALEVSPTAIFDMAAYIPGLTLIYIPRVRKNFHEFRTDINGGNLTEYSMLNILVGSFAVNDSISLSSTLVYVLSTEYTGTNNNPAYLTAQDITYSFNRTYSASLGIETGGQVRALERGQDENIKIFDADTTQFYAGFNLNF